MAALSTRERTLMGLAAVGLLAAAGYIFVLEPIRTANQEAAELIPAREARLERRQALIARREAVTAELADLGRQVEEQSARLLQGPTPPLAASELQKLVKELAAGAGVEVRSERVLPTVDKSGLQEVPIEITVAGGIRECVDLLYRLDRTDKLLTTQDLKIRVISAGQPRDLLATVTVSGYLMGVTPPAKPSDKPTAELGKAAGPKG
jgi:Tfp pilus assembly protein PilO